MQFLNFLLNKNCIQFCVLFKSPVFSLIKIQISFSERPPTKKRRLDITLQNCILNNLKPNLDQPEEVVIPWLQILAALINNLDPEVLEGKIHDYWKNI